MESIWSKNTHLPERAPLSGNISVQAAVIGGGMAGILTAYLLKEKGIDAVVLEAQRVGSGQTRNTTAKITSQHGLIYDKLLLEFGDLAGQYAVLNQKAIAEYRRIVNQLKIDCALEEVPAYLYSIMDAEPLRREAETASRLGIPASFVTETELPFSIKGAVRFDGQAQFDPLKFLKAVSERLTVFENTVVRQVKDNRIQTDKGTVEAEQIVFATHYPFLNVPGYYFMRMHQERSYLIALKNAMKLNGMYLGVDPDNSFSLRCAGEYLLLGGGEHRTGENRAGGKYEKLRQKAAELWPDSIEEAHWSAQDCMPMDSVPYIGQYAASTPSWYVATGFRKWGMTSSMAAAMLLSDAIAGRDNPYAEIFSPDRFTPSASAKNFFKDSGHAVKGLSRQIFAPARAAVADMPEGHGGIVEVDGEKLGVYRDDDGKLFAVSARCPHLGCQLEWNPDEKSWECPCHGSRFNYLGELINGPAQDGLEHE